MFSGVHEHKIYREINIYLYHAVKDAFLVPNGKQKEPDRSNPAHK